MLKLGILLDNEEIYLWQFQILEKLVNSDYVYIKYFLLSNHKCSKEKQTEYSTFYNLHEKIDRLIFSKSLEFNKKVNVLGLFKETNVVKFLNNQWNENSLIPHPADINIDNLDLILNFGNSSINNELLRVSKFGALTYCICNQSKHSKSPSCYWEVINEMPEIEVCIQISQAGYKQNIEIFRTGILPYPNSINKNRNNAYNLASILILPIIKQISIGGNVFLTELISKNNKSINRSFSNHPDLQYPTSIKALSNMLLLIFRFLQKKLLYYKIGRWFIFFRLNENNTFLPPDPSTLNVIHAPRGMFWADPFVITKDGFHYVFVEEYLFRTEKAHISVIKLDEKGTLLSRDTIIDKPYHMSYPHVFMHENSFYMIPETGSNKTIELYKCTSFPDKWIFVKNIMENIHAKDSTIFFYKNKWWLFVSIIECSNASMSFNELFLFYADDLHSSVWQSHPMNPIVSDHKLSRPAGAIFMHDGKIYRPSQDCSGIYGRALNVNCITNLNETEYEEVLISKTEPVWDNNVKGIHTYNFNEKIIFMDAFSFRKRIF